MTPRGKPAAGLRGGRQWPRRPLVTLFGAGDILGQEWRTEEAEPWR